MMVNNKRTKHCFWVLGFCFLAVIFLIYNAAISSIRDKKSMHVGHMVDLTIRRKHVGDDLTKMPVKAIQKQGQIVEEIADTTETQSQPPPKATPVITYDSNRTRTPTQCYNENLGPTRDDDLAKIESYKFKGIENYMKELFPLNSVNVSQEYPTFVSGFSSNHYMEGLVMLDALKETVRTKYKDVKVIVFDLGLSEPQLRQLEKTNEYEVKRFKFEDYPEHVKQLHNFAWKAIAIQIVTREYPFVIWMDASVRFKTSELDDLFKKVRDNGLLVVYEGKAKTGTIAERTHLKTFEFLDEKPCTYALHRETHGTIMMLYANPFITKYFLYPLVACGLNFGCMEPFSGGSKKLLHCPKEKELQFHLCHRSDQSVVGILFHRLFHFEPDKHKLDLKYFAACRNQKRMC